MIALASGLACTRGLGGLSARKWPAMATDLSEGLKEELRYGAATLTVLEELRDRVAHLVVFCGAAERAAKDVFELVQRISEKAEHYEEEA
jgi:hypothetical protein